MLFLFIEELRFLAFILFFGTFVFVAAAETTFDESYFAAFCEEKQTNLEDFKSAIENSTKISQKLGVCSENLENCTSLRRIDSDRIKELEEKKNDCLVALAGCDPDKTERDCNLLVGAKVQQITKIQAKFDNLTVYYNKLLEEVNDLRKTNSDLVAGRTIPVIDFSRMKSKLLKEKCRDITTIGFEDVLAIVHPEAYSTVINLDIAGLDYELDPGSRNWINSVRKRLKASSNREEFFTITNNYLKSMSERVSDCESAVKIIYQLKYFEEKIESATINRILNVYSGVYNAQEKTSLYKQLVHYLKSWFYVVEPINYNISAIPVAVVICTFMFIVAIVKNIGKLRRKLGDLGSVIAFIAGVTLIVYLMLMC